jgi:predicted DNA-binding protein with PD1-like motif
MNLEPKIGLKDGLLTIALRKQQEKTLRDACDFVGAIASISPVDPKIHAHAGSAKEHLGQLLALCVTAPTETIMEANQEGGGA